MVKRPPATVARLAQIAAQAAAAPHGGKAAIYTAACAELGMSQATLLRALHEVALRPQRKQRADAGLVALPLDEAQLISAMLMESLRKNNKRLLSIGQALEILRANGEVRAERVVPATGEVLPLGEAAVSRALRSYGLHPDQLLAPAPAVELKSLHSNHVWQIDASLCVLYYLNARTEAESGLQVMEARKFYKNKPANLKRIENDRVWSYEVTDHRSGSIFVTYVLGAESGVNMAESFIEAITPREGDPFHGVPQILMMDMGSANTGGLAMNLLRRLQVKPLPHAAENARATGQVENARNIIERNFESSLRLHPVASLAELKALAWRWARHYNATRVHSRHGMTRTECWLRDITEQQLRLAPPAELCRTLMTHAPEQRRVSPTLRVSFNGREYSVRDLPRVMVGEQLLVTYSPYVTDAALIVDSDANGHELLHTVPLVRRDEAGFSAAANIIGEDYTAAPVTLADTNRAAVERLAMDAATDAEAEAKRKAKTLPFGGRIDPYKPITDAPARTYMPRRGTTLAPGATVAQQGMAARVFSLFEAATELARRGLPMNAERNALVAALYPAGVPEQELAALQLRLQHLGSDGVASAGRGAAIEPRAAVRMNLAESLTRIRARVGSLYTAQVMRDVRAQWPQGMLPSEVDAVCLRLQGGADDEPLQAVQGL